MYVDILKTLMTIMKESNKINLNFAKFELSLNVYKIY